MRWLAAGEALDSLRMGAACQKDLAMSGEVALQSYISLPRCVSHFLSAILSQSFHRWDPEALPRGGEGSSTAPLGYRPPGLQMSVPYLLRGAVFPVFQVCCRHGLQVLSCALLLSLCGFCRTCGEIPSLAITTILRALGSSSTDFWRLLFPSKLLLKFPNLASLI